MFAFARVTNNSKNVFTFTQKSWQSLFRLLRSEGVRPDIVSVNITHAAK